MSAEDWERRQEQLDRSLRLTDLQNDLGPRYSCRRATLDAFEVYHPAQQQVLDRLRAWKAAWPTPLKEGKGLMLYGPCGTGKDHLLAALLYQAVGDHGLTARWTNGTVLYSRFRDVMHARDTTEEQILDHYAKPDILAISDPIPPSGEVTAFQVGQLFMLLDERYRSMKSTWITLNVTSEADAQARLSLPLFDRLREGAELVRCYWPSYRGRPRPAGEEGER
jgi:DNA replication protein DnaC